MPVETCRPLPLYHDPQTTPPSLRSGLVNRLDRDRIYECLPYTIPLPGHIAVLLRALSHAHPVEPARVPPDLVTMHSVVRTLNCLTGRGEEYALVYPYDADRLPMAASIAGLRGSSLFGHRVGDHAIWETPRGRRIVRIESLLYQPEREGHLDQ
jgi:regulator of nucleoside diphosphate kinase